MKPGRAGTMTHDYKRNGTTTLFAALNILDGTVIGRNMKHHRHQEFIRFLNDIDPRFLGERRSMRSSTTMAPTSIREAQMAPASPLDLPLHADLGVLAQCHRRFLRQAHQPAPQSRRVPIHPGTSGRNRSLRRGNQRRSQTLRMVGTPQPHPRRCQTREGKVRVDPLGMTAIMKSAPTPSDREVLTGVVERVTYQNAENGFCVLRVKARGHRELVTLVGHAAAISAGEWITASGSWVNDRTHGQQFKARFLKTSAPTSVEGIEK